MHTRYICTLRRLGLEALVPVLRVVVLPAICLAVLAPTTAAWGQSLDVFQQIEDRLLERRLQSYDEAFEREEGARERLAESIERLHSALGNAVDGG